MGRNPVVGRQGPAYHAATIPSEDEAKRLTVKQIRSGIGHAETMNRTLKALGLRHYQHVIEIENTQSARGMLFKVRHLIDVTPVKGS
ncbi:MAG TPA: 50S ribosomal protein L30 [Gemmatimonadales bacterium]|jgi:large subunit ribosomal protein L30